MVVTLYSVDGSPPSAAVMMTAELLELPLEKKTVNIAAREHLQPEYLEKNPTHTLPMIEDGDFILSDSHAIITYLVSKYGGDKRAILYPEDLKIRATIDQRMYVDATLVFPKIKSMVKALFVDKTGLTEQHFKEVEEAYGYLEKYLERSTFLAGDQITVADITTVSSVSSLNTVVPIEDKFPNLAAWVEKIKEKDWYLKGILPGLKNFEEVMKSAIQQCSRN